MQIIFRGLIDNATIPVKQPTWGRISKTLEELAEIHGLGDYKSSKRDDCKIELLFDKASIIVESSPGELRSASLYDEIESLAKSLGVSTNGGRRDSGSTLKKRDRSSQEKKETGRINLYTEIELGKELREAVKERDVASVKRLLADGADAQFDSNSPLRWAVLGGEFDITILLLDHGANPWDSSNTEFCWDGIRGDSLSIALQKKRLKIARVILEKTPWVASKPNTDYLSSVVRDKFVDGILFLLDAGFNPNINDGDPLDVAISERQYHLIDLLISRGAVAGTRALYRAVRTADIAMVKKIVSAGASPWTYEKDSRDCITDAESLGYHESATFLRELPGRPTILTRVTRGLKKLL